MKTLFVVLLFLSSLVQAQNESCYVLRLRGKVTLGPKVRTILINLGTQSEKTYHFPLSLQDRLAGHTRLFVVGDFVFKDEIPVNGSNVLGILDLKDDIPHPLEAASSQFVKKIACPK